MEFITIPFKNVRQKDKLFLTILNEQIECGKFYCREIDNEEFLKGDTKVLGMPLSLTLENLSEQGIEALNQDGLELAISTKYISNNQMIATIYDDTDVSFALSEIVLENKNGKLSAYIPDNATGFAIPRLLINKLLTSTDILSRIGLDERALTNEEIEQFFPMDKAEVKKNSALPKLSSMAILMTVVLAVVKVFFKGEKAEKMKKTLNEVLNNLKKEGLFTDDKEGESKWNS